MNLPSLLSAPLIVLALAGCATAPQTIAPEVAASLKRVAVVSVTGAEFTRKFVGFTVFGNELETKSITAWNLDKAYEAQLAAAAEKVFGATVVKAPYAVADFAPVNALKGTCDVPAYWGPHWDVIEAPVRDLCKAHQLDALLVAARQKSADPFAQTNQFITGAGIYAGRAASPALHLLSSVSLMDCRTGQPLVTQWLYKGTTGKFRDRLVTSPLTSEVARAPLAEWTPEIENSLRQELLELPKDAWAVTLRLMLPRP